MNFRERQQVIDLQQSKLQQQKIAAQSILKDIKEREKKLAQAQEELWTEQELPLLQLLDRIEQEEKVEIITKEKE
jgi:hypothetical protein